MGRDKPKECEKFPVKIDINIGRSLFDDVPDIDAFKGCCTALKGNYSDGMLGSDGKCNKDGKELEVLTDAFWSGDAKGDAKGDSSVAAIQQVNTD